MNAQRYLFIGLSGAGLSLGCSGPAPETEPLGRVQQELNVCNETVPDEHYVDGIPAYAQCNETTGAIWSDNGVDTSTTSLGSDWVRTQYSGGYQCTEYAYRYLYFRWDIDYRGGNGGEWCDGNLPDTLLANTTPVHGDLVVFSPGSCGADSYYGHIAVVDSVNEAQASVTFVEQNRANRRSCPIDTANCFLHAVANDGPTGTGGTGGEGGSSAGGGSGGSPDPSCSDGVQNQDETSIDCGGSSCPGCADGASCVVATDCTSGMCSNGICGCPAGLTACAGTCVDVNSDAANCGGCGYACAAGTVCNQGVCSPNCAAGLTLCGQECVDLSSSLADCGACDAVCALPGAVSACVAGTCTLTSCAAGAVDLDQDPSNGCEYACQATGAEACNGLDDDCNGEVDDGGVCVGSGGTGGATVTPATGGSPSGGSPTVGSGGASDAPEAGGSPSGGSVTVASGGSPTVGTGGAIVTPELGGAPSGGAALVGTGGDTVVGAGGIDANPGTGGAQSGDAAPTDGLSADGDPVASSPSFDEQQSGCGCFVAGSRRTAALPLGWALAAVLVLRRRRLRSAG